LATSRLNLAYSQNVEPWAGEVRAFCWKRIPTGLVLRSSIASRSCPSVPRFTDLHRRLIGR
jgi:hypothetical protein